MNAILIPCENLDNFPISVNIGYDSKTKRIILDTNGAALMQKEAKQVIVEIQKRLKLC